MSAIVEIIAGLNFLHVRIETSAIPQSAKRHSGEVMSPAVTSVFGLPTIIPALFSPKNAMNIPIPACKPI